MKLIRTFIFILIGVLPQIYSQGQDTLPAFTVKNRFGKVIVSWTNLNDSLVQISVQRSADSLKGFKTILTIPDPKAITNGFLDTKAPNTTQYYKLYVQQPGGKFFFTKSQKPVVDSSRTVKYELAGNKPTGIKFVNGVPQTDSSKAKVPDLKNVFTPSIFVYTNPEGNVVIALPEQKIRAYSLKFYLPDGTQIFQMSQVKETFLTLDKSNFQRSGWFNFELYENNILKEKSKLFIPKDRQ
ncbi:MAG: hypothetical protein ACRC2O_18180 [Chitinophagaceae bacterium]